METIKELKDLAAFHTSVSVALGMALQHLVDSFFVQLANFILLRRDSYLEYVKPGLKPDTWNKLRNTPLFNSGLFPDDVLATAEQNIQKMHHVLKVPVWVHISTLVKSINTGINLMIRRTVGSQVTSLLRLSRLGDNFQAEAEGGSNSPYFTKSSCSQKPYK